LLLSLIMAEPNPRRGHDQRVTAADVKRLVALRLFDLGLDCATIAKKTGCSRGWIIKLITRERGPQGTQGAPRGPH
jgi:hypothetical protein